MRHIIIEGPDGAGKTTLARTLCTALGMRYHHEGPPPADERAYKHYITTFNRNAIEGPTVFDRFHLGELVYGPLLRGRSALGMSDIVLLDEHCMAHDVRLIICMPPWPVCRENNRNKEELIKDEATLQAAYGAWAQIVNASKYSHIYDYTEVNGHVPR